MNFKELREELEKVDAKCRAAGVVDCSELIEVGELVLDNLPAILAALSIAERGKWVKCEELLPEHGKIVALKGYNEDDSFVGFWCEKGEHWEVNNMYCNRRRFSYWHPLSPLPPEEK